MPDKKHVNIFGTTFCVPKGKRVGPGYTVLDVECEVPEITSPEHKARVKEIIRDDIEKLYGDLGTSDINKLTPEQMKDWVAKNPYTPPKKPALPAA